MHNMTAAAMRPPQYAAAVLNVLKGVCVQSLKLINVLFTLPALPGTCARRMTTAL